MAAFLLLGKASPYESPSNITPASFSNDDYPAKWKEAKRGTLTDDGNNLNRECTSFVWWCLFSRNGYTLALPAEKRNSINWADSAREMGIIVDNNPAVGSVAWWDLSKTVNSGYGHVAWVAEVNGEYIAIEEYNYIGDGIYSARIIHKSEVHAYIHFKDIKSSGSYYEEEKPDFAGMPVTYSENAKQTYTYEIKTRLMPPPEKPLPASLDIDAKETKLDAYEIEIAGETDVKAVPISSIVLVNGEEISFEAYTIKSNNYFKLRDLAYVLNGTEKQFEVVWDSENNAIYIFTGQPYTKTGIEMTGKSVGGKMPVPSASTVYLNEKIIYMTAYNIGGSNYFKLRDMGQAFDFGIDWDEAQNTIMIDTSKGYAP